MGDGGELSSSAPDSHSLPLPPGLMDRFHRQAVPHERLVLSPPTANAGNGRWRPHRIWPTANGTWKILSR